MHTQECSRLESISMIHHVYGDDVLSLPGHEEVQKMEKFKT